MLAVIDNPESMTVKEIQDQIVGEIASTYTPEHMSCILWRRQVQADGGIVEFTV